MIKIQPVDYSAYISLEERCTPRLESQGGFVKVGTLTKSFYVYSPNGKYKLSLREGTKLFVHSFDRRSYDKVKNTIMRSHFVGFGSGNGCEYHVCATESNADYVEQYKTAEETLFQAVYGVMVNIAAGIDWSFDMVSNQLNYYTSSPPLGTTFPFKMELNAASRTMQIPLNAPASNAVEFFNSLEFFSNLFVLEEL